MTLSVTPTRSGNKRTCQGISSCNVDAELDVARGEPGKRSGVRDDGSQAGDRSLGLSDEESQVGV